MKAKKRRIKKITVEIVPKWHGLASFQTFVILRPGILRAGGPVHFVRSANANGTMHRSSGAKNAPRDDKGELYLRSKSTGAVTSCTRKCFASAGYFLATASYIA